MTNYKKHMFRAVSRKRNVLLAAVVLSGVMAFDVPSADAAGQISILKPVYYERAVNGKTLLNHATVDDTSGNAIKLNVEPHFSKLAAGSMQISAVSQDSTIVEVVVNGMEVTLFPFKQGTTYITITGNTDGVNYSDRIKVEVTKIGDATGDGNVTSADVLYIYKVVNNKLQISDEERNRLDIDRDGSVTAKDATLLMNSYVGKSGSAGTIAFVLNITDVNDAPFAHHLQLPQNMKSGDTITALYEYTDVESNSEGASLYQWYTDSSANGGTKTPITGATDKSYTIKQGDEQKYLFFGVKPVPSTGNTGSVELLSGGIYVPDTIAPTVTATTPANNETVMTKTGAISLTFSEDVKAAAGKNVVLRKTSGDSAVVTYAANDTSKVTISGGTVTLVNPGIDDANGYYLEVDAGAFTDLAGNPYAGISGKTTWSFTIPDITGPVVTGQTPAANDPAANPTASLTLTFDENVKAAANKSVVIRLKSDDSAVRTYAADDTSKVTITGNTVTLLTPALQEQVEYYVEAEAGAFTDTSGNPMAGIAGKTGWVFKTADLTAPTVTATTPANNETVMTKTGAISLTFSEDVKAAAGKNVVLRKTSGDSAVVTYAANDTSRVTISGGTVTLVNPGIDDANGYYLEVDAGAFTDLAGNPYAGISGKTWSFTIPDITGPVVTGQTPAANDPAANPTASLTLTFDENVKAAANESVVIRLKSDDSAVRTYAADDTSKVTITGNTVTLLTPALQEQVEYYVEAEAGAFTDTSGNPMAGIAGKTSWAFKTADLTAPTLTTTTPANNETVMTKTGAISLTFSEDVKAAAGKNVVLRKTSGDSAVFTYAANDTSKVTISGGTVTLINPGIGDANGYYLEVDAGAFTDLAGNPYAGISGKTTWSFTIPDITDPSVTALTPAASASNADAATELKLTFSEAVTAAAGKTITIYKASDDSVVYTYQADDTGHVSISGNEVVLQNPALEPLVSYYILVEPGAFQDAATHPYAGITSKTGWSFTTINAVSVSATVDAPLDELSLTQGAAIYVAVTGNTFLDSVSAADFVLNQAPQGLTIAGAGKMGEDTVFLILDFDKTYFANNFDHFSITVKGSALSGGQDAQTNELSIQAVSTLAQATVFPANHSTLNSLEATFSLTYSEDVKAVAGKSIRIYNAATNTLVETIAATDTTKVTIKNNVVTIAHSALSPGTQYYVQMDAWAFESTTGTPAAGITTSTDWKFTTATVSTVAYISDLVIGSNGRAAIQVFGNNVDNAGMNNGYELFFHQYVHATNQVRVWSLPFLPFYPGMPYIVLNSNFYDFFDITSAYYFNEEAYFELSGYTLNALVLKKDGVIVDVVGDPSATTQKGILPSGGTLVRKKNTMKGSTTFMVNEWDSYPKDTFMFLGKHTQ